MAHGKFWHGANRIYSPFNLDDRHWIALEIILDKRAIYVYDCNIQLYKDSDIVSVLTPMAQLLPILLKKSMVFADIDDTPFSISRIQDFPQDNGG